MSHLIVTNYNKYHPNASRGCGGQRHDIDSVSCDQTSRVAGGVVRNYTERGDAASIYILGIVDTLCK